jgi:stage II sporulation protein D
VASARGGVLRLSRGRDEVRLRLARAPVLMGYAGGKATGTARLELWPGDRVRYRTDAAGQVGYLELRPPIKGVSDDRSAAVYAWEVRKTRREIEDAIGARVSVGRVRDLRVVRRGVSGRIVELEVVGESGSQVVRGFDVRNLLGLRESLVVFEIQRAASGAIEAVVFAGKGWGHGVGLCQVGAYGMALRGESYESILTHYYRGAALERIP